jgi:hypothetical protein
MRDRTLEIGAPSRSGSAIGLAVLHPLSAGGDSRVEHAMALVSSSSSVTWLRTALPDLVRRGLDAPDLLAGGRSAEDLPRGGGQRFRCVVAGISVGGVVVPEPGDPIWVAPASAIARCIAMDAVAAARSRDVIARCWRCRPSRGRKHRPWASALSAWRTPKPALQGTSHHRYQSRARPSPLLARPCPPPLWLCAAPPCGAELPLVSWRPAADTCAVSCGTGACDVSWGGRACPPASRPCASRAPPRYSPSWPRSRLSPRRASSRSRPPAPNSTEEP